MSSSRILHFDIRDFGASRDGSRRGRKDQRDHDVAGSRLGVGTMQSAERIHTLWSLVRASSAEGQRTRRRLGAGAALTMLMSGLLTAIGVAIIVVALAAVVLVVAGGAAAAKGAMPRPQPLPTSLG